jgi:hypothetical protein
MLLVVVCRGRARSCTSCIAVLLRPARDAWYEVVIYRVASPVSTASLRYCIEVWHVYSLRYALPVVTLFVIVIVEVVQGRPMVIWRW